MQALSHATAQYLRHALKSAFPIARHRSCTTGALWSLSRTSTRGRDGLRCLSWSSNRAAPSLEDSRFPAIGGASTIYALSTPPGKAAIAIIRISGPACTEIYRNLCPNRPPPKPRFATLRTIYDPSKPPTKDSTLDPGALIIYFPASNSVTGEDVLELHVHGGPAVVKSVLSAIPCCASSSKVHTIRYAEPGEFTRRAFMNDRLDLTQVEALGDTLSATTEQQRRLSVRGTTSGLAKRYESWRQQLLYARGELEALIDFSEDQHFDESPAQLAASVTDQVKGLQRQIQAHSANAVRGELLRNGITISLLGAPNAGKSSLLNRIVGREAAIVSKEAGTTRDVVEVGLDIGGWYCRLGDMAGLRTGLAADKISAFVSSPNESGKTAIVGEVEQEGIKRAKQRALESDVVIVVLSIEPSSDGSLCLRIDPVVQQTAAEGNTDRQNTVVVVNKVDWLNECSESPTLPPQWTAAILQAIPSLRAAEIFPISCRLADIPNRDSSDPGGVQAFLNGLIQKFQDMTAPVQPEGMIGDKNNFVDPSVWQESLGATERQRLLLEECLVWLDGFFGVVGEATAAAEVGDDVDIVAAAESLRGAAECLARITGRGESGDVEEVLGVVFEK